MLFQPWNWWKLHH